MNIKKEIEFEKDALLLLKNIGSGDIKYGIGVAEDNLTGKSTIVVYKYYNDTFKLVNEYEFSYHCVFRTILLIVNKIVYNFDVDIDDIALI